MRKDQICRILAELLEVISEQPKQPAHSPHLVAGFFYSLVRQVKDQGVPLDHFRDGPWQVDDTGELGTPEMPAVYRGKFAMLDHEPRMCPDIAAMLNWCELPEPIAPSPRASDTST